jgi:DNA-binding CsgD family transcriptional regulator
MKTLSHGDFLTVLKAIELINTDFDPSGLPKRMLSAITHAVTCDITAFEVVGKDGVYQGTLIYEPCEAVNSDDLAIYNSHVHEHPLYTAIIANRRFDAIAIADCQPDREFLRSAIYNEYYRRIGIKRQASVTLDINEQCIVVCTLSRAGSDFDEREKMILNLISPHFTSAVRNAHSVEFLQHCEQNWQTVAESMGHAVVTFDRERRIKYESRNSRELLGKYFGSDVGQINGLPLSLSNWVGQNIQITKMDESCLHPPSPFVTSNRNGTLTIRLSQSKELNLINLLLIEERVLTPQQLLKLGLTHREAEVLCWISQGKTNPEIALLCRISERTVHKHVEHIYSKLGIESRTAALLRAREALG